ncbi:hypothetical protein [Spongiimicrobium sp. 3-5]|uniref:hypothetical protein n=1 Tax=Spongiimicrobium sp. 3-5 TaxID=3332596 RepID=UPI00397FD850
MKRSLSPFLSVLIAILFLGCASYKDQKQRNALSFPEIGSVISQKDVLWHKNTSQVGTPKWADPLTITVQELPFNIRSYGIYAKYMANAGKINSIAFVDSLPYKPKYLRLEIADKMELVDLLNSSENNNVRNYLATNSMHKLVTSWNITLPDALIAKLLSATQVTLCEDSRWGKHFLFTTGKQEERLPFSEIQVFDYETATFCWGEDRYHRKKIKALLPEGTNCPKGTFKKADKVESDKSYLKF